MFFEKMLYRNQTVDSGLLAEELYRKNVGYRILADLHRDLSIIAPE